jgi:hypothetical protein
VANVWQTDGNVVSKMILAVPDESPSTAGILWIWDQISLMLFQAVLLGTYVRS